MRAYLCECGAHLDVLRAGEMVKWARSIKVLTAESSKSLLVRCLHSGLESMLCTGTPPRHRVRQAAHGC
jgi:hypothetical protein